MRVLLINPFYPISETPSPPLGLAYLAAALEQAGAEVRILDYVVYPYRREVLESVLKEFKPRIAGATAVSMTVDHARQVLDDVKAIDPQIITVMGGPHVTFCARETLEAFTGLDAVVIGEGEETLVELLRAVEGACSFETVAGIAYREKSKIVNTTKRKWIKDLDALPLPARHLLPLGRYRALGMPISLTTSRGCPYKCIFCVGRKMGGAKVRFHSPERVADELQYLADLKFHQINIADDLFTANPHHCLAVCEEIRQRNLDIKWTSFARVDTISEKLLKKMTAAGCTAVSFGIESANPAILKRIKKGITIEQVRNAVRTCRRVGISPYASFILGLPGETPRTIEETKAFAAKMQEEGLAYGFHILAPFPGTEVRARNDRLGIRILSDDWSRYDANRAVIETSDVSRRMLDAVVVDWEDRYHRYLGNIHENIQNGKATDEEIGQLENLEKTVALYDLMMQSRIEECGILSPAAAGPDIGNEKAFALLIDCITRLSDMKPGRIKAALQQTVAAGNLILTHKGDGPRWEWESFLEVTKVN